MAVDSLLPYILTSCSQQYPDYIDLNLRLLELYGADLSCSATKCGDCFHIKIGISVIDQRFSIDGSNPVAAAAELINGLIFNPSLTDGFFLDRDIQREKRKTIERIEGEINNKRAFARTRLLEEMFGSDPYGKFSYGTVKEVENITGEMLYAAWRRLLENSFIRICMVGSTFSQDVFSNIKKCFAGINRNDITDISRFIKLSEAENVKDITQRFDVSQGKLAMGFTSKLHGSIKEAAALSVFTDIFGGGPYSKLFENVREKQSLCYYCSASARRSKGFVVVDSGIEEENADKVIKAVLKELEDIKCGKFEDSVIEASKKSITDSLLGYYDNAHAIDAWYSRELNDTTSPEEAVEVVMKVEKRDIINAAMGVKLHTIYRLLTKGGER
jgi:predicted Zn-dependent peptidase